MVSSERGQYEVIGGLGVPVSGAGDQTGHALPTLSEFVGMKR